MSVLVTGGTGFLGSRLCDVLCTDGIEVRVLARPTSDTRRIAELPVDIAYGDITDPSSVRDALDGVERVYHVAALYELGTPDPDRMWRINVGGTTSVLTCAAERGMPAVHVSSVAALGPTSTEPVGEAHWNPERPRSAYDATKRESHLIARRIAREGAAVSIALPGTIYGPDDPSLVGRFHAFASRAPLIVGALPTMRMSLVHVDDCAEGLLLIASKGEQGPPGHRSTGDGEYILAAQVVTFRQWIHAIAAAAGRRAPFFHLPRPLLRVTGPLVRLAAPLAGISRGVVAEGLAMSQGNTHWAFTAGKAREQLGWEPRPFNEGIADTIDSYKQRKRSAG